jgi:hypothetical protein
MIIGQLRCMYQTKKMADSVVFITFHFITTNN